MCVCVCVCVPGGVIDADTAGVRKRDTKSLGAIHRGKKGWEKKRGEGRGDRKGKKTKRSRETRKEERPRAPPPQKQGLSSPCHALKVPPSKTEQNETSLPEGALFQESAGMFQLLGADQYPSPPSWLTSPFLSLPDLVGRPPSSLSSVSSIKSKTLSWPLSAGPVSRASGALQSGVPADGLPAEITYIPSPRLQGHVTTKVHKPSGPRSTPSSSGEAQRPLCLQGAALPSLGLSRPKSDHKPRLQWSPASVPREAGHELRGWQPPPAVSPAPHTLAAGLTGLLEVGLSTLHPAHFLPGQTGLQATFLRRHCLDFLRNLNQTPTLGRTLLASAFR